MKRKMTCRIITSALMMLIFFVSSCVSAEENNGKYLPTRSGIAITAGRSYDPENNIDFYMLSGFMLFDYDKIWKHKAPENLRFKIEGSGGAAHKDKTRLVLSGNIFALYYLDWFKSRTFKPYVEGGIGIMYTDFQVEGQGLRLNFNPQIGLGTEIKAGKDETFFLALRLHHISNAGLDDQNRGVNSVMFMLGFHF
jgi:lipid A 3-O-deacylase